MKNVFWSALRQCVLTHFFIPVMIIPGWKPSQGWLSPVLFHIYHIETGKNNISATYIPSPCEHLCHRSSGPFLLLWHPVIQTEPTFQIGQHLSKTKDLTKRYQPCSQVPLLLFHREAPENEIDSFTSCFEVSLP